MKNFSAVEKAADIIQEVKVPLKDKSWGILWRLPIPSILGVFITFLTVAFSLKALIVTDVNLYLLLLLLALVLIVTSTFTIGYQLAIVEDVHLNGTLPSLAKCFSASFKKFPKALGPVTIILVLAAITNLSFSWFSLFGFTSIGTLIIAICSIILTVRFSYSVFQLIDEDSKEDGTFKIISNSWSITKGHTFKILLFELFLFCFVVGFPVWLLTVVWAVITAIFSSPLILAVRAITFSALLIVTGFWVAVGRYKFYLELKEYHNSNQNTDVAA